MAGYWPSSSFACLWTETESRFINSQKTERGQYQAILTEQAWSIKDLLHIWLSIKDFNKRFIIWLSPFPAFLRDMAGSPERAR